MKNLVSVTVTASEYPGLREGATYSWDEFVGLSAGAASFCDAGYYKVWATVLFEDGSSKNVRFAMSRDRALVDDVWPERSR